MYRTVVVVVVAQVVSSVRHAHPPRPIPVYLFKEPSMYLLFFKAWPSCMTPVWRKKRSLARWCWLLYASRWYKACSSMPKIWLSAKIPQCYTHTHKNVYCDFCCRCMYSKRTGFHAAEVYHKALEIQIWGWGDGGMQTQIACFEDLLYSFCCKWHTPHYIIYLHRGASSTCLQKALHQAHNNLHSHNNGWTVCITIDHSPLEVTATSENAKCTRPWGSLPKVPATLISPALNDTISIESASQLY